MSNVKKVTKDDYLNIVDESGHRLCQFGELAEFVQGSSGVGVGTVVRSKTSPGPNWLQLNGNSYDRTEHPELAALYPEAGFVATVTENFALHGISRFFDVGTAVLALPYGEANESLYYTKNLYRSTDNGVTWQHLTNVFPNGIAFGSSFVQSKDTGRIMLISRSGNKPYYSDDAGITWHAAGLLPFSGGYSIAAAWTPENGFIAINYSSPGRMATSPDGLVWTDVVPVPTIDFTQYGYGWRYVNNGGYPYLELQSSDAVNLPALFYLPDLTYADAYRSGANNISPNFWGGSFGVADKNNGYSYIADTVRDMLSVSSYSADNYLDNDIRVVLGDNPFGYLGIAALTSAAVFVGLYGKDQLYGKVTTDAKTFRTVKLLDYPGVAVNLAWNGMGYSGDSILLSSGLDMDSMYVRVTRDTTKFNVSYMPDVSDFKHYILAKSGN